MATSLMRSLALLVLVLAIGQPVQGRSIARMFYLHGYKVYEAAIEGPQYFDQPIRNRCVLDLRAYGLPSGVDLIDASRDGNFLFIWRRSTLWRIDVRRREPIRRFDVGSDWAISPDSTDIAVSQITDRGRASIWLLNIGSGQRRLLYTHALSPSWSGSGRYIAFIEQVPDESGEAPVAVINTKTDRVVFTTPARVNPTNLSLSRSGRYLAVDFHLSRPVTGHTVFDISTGKTLDSSRFSPRDYLPALILDWSPDDRWVLCDWRVADKRNNGKWLGDVIGVASVRGKIRRFRIGNGSDASFITSGHEVLCLRAVRKSPSRGYNLVLSSLYGRRQIVVAVDVTSYVWPNY